MKGKNGLCSRATQLSFSESPHTSWRVSHWGTRLASAHWQCRIVEAQYGKVARAPGVRRVELVVLRRRVGRCCSGPLGHQGIAALVMASLWPVWESGATLAQGSGWCCSGMVSHCSGPWGGHPCMTRVPGLHTFGRTAFQKNKMHVHIPTEQTKSLFKK